MHTLYTVFAQYVDDEIVELALNLTRKQASRRALEEADLDECCSVHISDDADRTWDWNYQTKRWVRA